MTTETITLGGGCFWCLEAVYEQVDGVVAVESGYSNGHVRNPTYQQVCEGNTGHVEVVRVLIAYGADVNAQDGEGRTPWQRASRARKCAAIREMLKDAGARKG